MTPYLYTLSAEFNLSLTIDNTIGSLVGGVHNDIVDMQIKHILKLEYHDMVISIANRLSPIARYAIALTGRGSGKLSAHFQNVL